MSYELSCYELHIDREHFPGIEGAVACPERLNIDDG